MTTVEILLSINLAVTAIIGLVVLFAKHFVKGWVEGGIGEHFSKRGEKRARETQTRLKAELVAELLAEWVSPNKDRRKLRELTNKAFLWLPKNIAIQLSDLLTNSGKTDIRKVLCEVRYYLLDESRKEGLNSTQVITYPLTPHEVDIKNANQFPSIKTSSINNTD